MISRSHFFLMGSALLVWATVLLTWQAGYRLTDFDAQFELLNIPAGVAMFIVMVCGFWGAAGIALCELGSNMLQQDAGLSFEVLSRSLITGFAPLLGLKLASMLLGIKADLRNLRPLHLPVQAVLASATMGVFQSTSAFIFESLPASHLVASTLADMASAFAGTLAVVVAALFSVKLFRLMTTGRFNAY